MATKATGTLIVNLDGAAASETIHFTIGGKSYEIDPAPNSDHKGVTK